MIKKFTLTIKGQMPVMRHDITLGRDYVDIKDDYGQTEFIGTDEQLSDEIARMRAVSPGINIIGVKEEKYTEQPKIETSEERFNKLYYGS